MGFQTAEAPMRSVTDKCVNEDGYGKIERIILQREFIRKMKNENTNINASNLNTKNLLKFIFGSAFGILMFLVPVPQGDSFTTLLDYIKTFLKNLFGASLPYILMILMIVSGVLTLYNFICKPEWIQKNNYLRKGFSASPFYLISKEIGMIVSIMVVLGFGPEWILSADTGASMVDLSCTLVCIVISFSFLLPFLTDCGIMEFFGVILRPVVHPLFRVLGRASVDLIASWFGASNAAAILTREQYMKGENLPARLHTGCVRN